MMTSRNTLLTSKFGTKNTFFNFLTRKPSSDENDIIVKNIKNKVVVILNRPKLLNSLNIYMVRKLLHLLKEWENNKSLVIIRGAGEKSFSSGGDVKSIVEAIKRGDKSFARTFFRDEYITNSIIQSYKIPYIAFIDGIVMGSGVGISIHGKYRVATERTIFAMPETQIGLFPDVGSSYFLPRLCGRVGWYLGLTGHRLKGADLLKVGIATHFCESSQLNDLEDALLNCSNEQDVRTTLNNFSKPDNADFSLAPVLDKINYCFSANTVEEILARLEKDGSTWAENTVKLLNKMSPTSLKITFKELELGQSLNLRECLQMEYRLALNCFGNKDFLEGVRAQLIDKDQNPKWDPPTLSEVTQAILENYFTELPEEQEFKNKL